jgi:hypothetical protein
MVPLYAARVQDLGPDDVAVFKCGACGHTAELPLSALLGVTTRSVQNRTLSRKPRKFSGFHKRSFVKWISVERKILRLFLSKPTFRTVSKGKGDLKGSLAYDFELIVW